MKEMCIVGIMLVICGCVSQETQQIQSDLGTTTTSILAVASSDLDDDTTTKPTIQGEYSQNSPITTSKGGDRPVTTTLYLDNLKTFSDNGKSVCHIDGKPIIRMYSKKKCIHCEWGASIFDKVALEYMKDEKVIAYHWELGEIEDDLLSEGIEGRMPDSEYKIFEDSNAKIVPYFDLGCRFTRVGNGYYVRNDAEAEEKEYRNAINTLIRLINLQN
jgi:hypothetical protein